MRLIRSQTTCVSETIEGIPYRYRKEEKGHHEENVLLMSSTESLKD